MRPSNWNEMELDEKVDYAKRLFGTVRGHYIVGQALAIAELQLRDKEPSNAEDMAVLGETLFNIGWAHHRFGGEAGGQKEEAKS